jgi:hypothetical protein
MPKQSEREDLDHQPENAGKVGETHKRLNEQAEVPRPIDEKDPGKGPVPTR